MSCRGALYIHFEGRGVRTSNGGMSRAVHVQANTDKFRQTDRQTGTAQHNTVLAGGPMSRDQGRSDSAWPSALGLGGADRPSQDGEAHALRPVHGVVSPLTV